MSLETIATAVEGAVALGTLALAGFTWKLATSTERLVRSTAASIDQEDKARKDGLAPIVVAPLYSYISESGMQVLSTDRERLKDMLRTEHPNVAPGWLH